MRSQRGVTPTIPKRNSIIKGFINYLIISHRPRHLTTHVVKKVLAKVTLQKKDVCRTSDSNHIVHILVEMEQGERIRGGTT
jgi:hypothetical protein